MVLRILNSLIIVWLIVGCNSNDKSVDRLKLNGYDYRLFQNTPVRDLAAAVQNEDTVKIREEIENEKKNQNYQEPKFGTTLLMLAIGNSKYKSSKTLLNLGAKTEMRNYFSGSTAMIYAAANEDPSYIKLLLAYGADPNSVENKRTKEGDEARTTPLNVSISSDGASSLDKVKLLVEAGADVNYFKTGAPAYTYSPLATAFMAKKMHIVRYLLEKGADYRKLLYQQADGHDVYILEALRKCVFDLNSKDYQEKMAIVAYLQQKDLDYSKEPIPEYVLQEIKNKYHDGWEIYIKKY